MNRSRPWNDVRSAKLGFTIIELLAAVAIIGVLLAIAVPAVQSAREASRRAQCLSNLRQIGIAAQNYESMYRMFPGPQMANRQDYLQLLPFLDQSSIDPSGKWPVEDAPRVAVYACPSDVFAVGAVFQNHVSYMPSEGVLEYDGFIRAGDLINAGPPAQRRIRQVRPADITDGLSMTAAYSERLVFPSPQLAYNPPYAFPEHWNRHLRQIPVGTSDLDVFAAACTATTLPPGSGWYYQDAYNHIMTPNQNSCRSELLHTLHAVTASSQHPGGVHTLLADGAVRFIGDGIDVAVWRGLGTRAGNEVHSF